jgi:hypothetical protein
MFKQAVAIWTKVPGLPLTVSNPISQPERLPGMTDWAPREVISRMGEGMRRGEDLDALVEQEKNEGLGGTLSKGTALGGIGGGLLGRLFGGEAATAPAQDILRKGLNMRGLQGLAKTPAVMKAMTLGGLGLGALGSGVGWLTDRDERGEQARAVARGLRREQSLQQNANLQNQVLREQLLTHNPMPSASAPQPLVVQSSKGI